MDRSKHVEVKLPEDSRDEGPTTPKFEDERWKKGTWDLNMFVENGRVDWDGIIVAAKRLWEALLVSCTIWSCHVVEARRRRFLELFPEAATNQEPVLFRSSIIPWWAWIRRSHLPEAELINGRAAMIGFFMAYLVDALTGLDVVGQTGNFVCKAGLLVTVIGVVLFRRRRDLETLSKLAEEATYYDKQWQASWESDGTAEKKP
ncbi:light-harvesting complex-like protein 3 isotype 1, chloroplastic [Punica granatum]|uniref:Light-harvesting complex-like protein 3 isotype 1, chloroplastic n=1 Tax=Punica granatum TaxID=22663 RepID=A0A6P8DL03_PUNGR|nr:light-harvesting complex-like protein 3 isotype 1, chloroplastic [Punica granatum]